jgi:Family of unknown function (DUF5713)
LPLRHSLQTALLIIGTNVTREELTMQLANDRMSTYFFLKEMEEDSYFPPHLVAKGKDILRRFCQNIETIKPTSLDELYNLSHQATEEFNTLSSEFEDEGSELETAARENIGADFYAIAKAYGFNADIEELIAPREW